MFFKKIKGLFFLPVLFLFVNSCADMSQVKTTTMVDKKVQHVINNAVFEVLIKKPVKDSLTYEKELPVHLIPFSIRNDKYYSIGTAFAIGQNEFISAAHVVNVNYETQIDQIFIRDKAGKIYELDKVLNYSNYRDFVVFTVKGNPAVKEFFKLNTKPELNENVIAVGNALGEGIIARNGILTSRTPEDEKGLWQWIRFSAAASPGNSGGPLLNERGAVIGIVLRKSENENLNYALPISEISVLKNVAIDHKRVRYSLPNMEKTKMITYDYQVRLPKNYIALRNDFVQHENKYALKVYKDFIRENNSDLFPKGDGAKEFLHNNQSSFFPGIISQDKNGNWDAYYPKQTKDIKLKKNGLITFGVMSNFLVLKLKKPDGESLNKLLSDPKYHMDLILKGLPFSRSFMGEQIRVTSIGKPVESKIYTDHYGRKWVASTWYTEYNDKKLLCFTLPIPGGTYSIFIDVPTSSDYMIDLEYLTDYVHLGYYGTFDNWNEFLKEKKYIPGVFKNVKFSYKDDSKVSFKNKSFSFTYDKKLFNITKNSDMSLDFSYIKETNKVLWDITGISIGEDKNNNNSFFLFKENKPTEGLSEETFSFWKKLENREYPFNKTPYFYKGKTYIKTVYDKSKKSHIYTMGVGVEGKKDDEYMKNKLNRINSLIKIIK